MKKNSLYPFAVLVIIIAVLFIFVQQKLSLHAWVGEYSYSESFPAGPPDNPTERYGTVEYLISIFKTNNSYYAEIKNEGNQTNINILACIVGNGDKVELLFDSYLPNNTSGNFKKNDLLLSFSRKGNELFTTWNIIESNTSILDETDQGVYFKKIN